MGAASEQRVYTQGVRRWRKRFGLASIVFLCLFSGMLVYVPWPPWPPYFSAGERSIYASREGGQSGRGGPQPWPPYASTTGARTSSIVPQPRLQQTVALTADANIREGPSTDTPLVGTISSGTRLTVTGKMEDYAWYHDWYRVRLPEGTTGYILGALTVHPEWVLAPAHTSPTHMLTSDAPAIVTDPPATDTGKGVPKSSILPSTPSSREPTPPIEPRQVGQTEFGFGATSAPLMPMMISAVALAVSLLGFLSTTVIAWRGDRRAIVAEARAQEEHGWKKVDRGPSSGIPL